MKAIVRLLLVVGVVTTCGSAPAGHTAATARVMREKLVHSQQVLRAIMISDDKLLEQERARQWRA